MKTQSTRHTPADCGKCGSPRRLLALEFRCECERPAQYLSHQFPVYSAAPKLLEACKAGGRYSDALLKYQERGITGFVGPSDELEVLFKDWHYKTHAAIAKATGETL